MATCPVCRFSDREMTDPPQPYYICPCCGTEFGLDDEDVSHSDLRQRWVRHGSRWFSRYTPQPKNWDPTRQLGFSRVATAATAQSKSVVYRGWPARHTVTVR